MVLIQPSDNMPLYSLSPWLWFCYEKYLTDFLKMEQKRQIHSKISLSLTQSLSSDESVTRQWELFKEGRGGGGEDSTEGSVTPLVMTPEPKPR